MLRAGEVGLHGQPISGRLDAGCFPSGVDPFIEGLTSALAGSGFHSEAVEKPMRLKYGKLLSNLANGVHAVCSEREAAGDFIERLRAEGVACFEAAGIDYTPPEELAIGRSGWDWGEIPGLQRTGGSTHQSFSRHLPTIETDYLNGEVMLLGKLHGVPTPANRAIQLITNRSLNAGLGPGSVPLAEIEALERELATSSIAPR